MSTPEKRAEIATQVKAANALHQRLLGACWVKCVPKPRDGDLTIGEMACLDRCVPKYLETHEAVGKELAELRGGRPIDYP